MVTDRTGIFHEYCRTAVVIRYALFPPRQENAGYNSTASVEPSSGDIEVNGDNVRFFLAELKRASIREGKLRMFFPGCLALAAPFLLFRLKREGFSNCRVLMTGGGLLLTASR